MSVTGDATPRKKVASARPQGATRKPARPKPAALLAWYDRNRRVLAWRAPPGARSDPYRVWLSEIMLQQTSVKTVTPYYARFLDRFPTVNRLAAAPLADVLRAWAGLGYYARARNLHACAQVVAGEHGGRFPESEAGLRALPGIGAYTAAAIAAIAFEKRATPVDGNVERVVARLHAVEEPLPGAKALIYRLAQALTPPRRAGDFAQAMMDLGATVCTPKQPACMLCPWRAACAAHRLGEPARYPRRSAKPEGRLRRGAAFVVVRQDGFVLVRTRPANGLLGGMTEVPTTAWTHGFDAGTALGGAPQSPSWPATARWRRCPGIVTHTFTHFPLELVVYRLNLPPVTAAPDGMRWVAVGELDGEALPNLMRKVLAHARNSPAPARVDHRRIERKRP